MKNKEKVILVVVVILSLLLLVIGISFSHSRSGGKDKDNDKNKVVNREKRYEISDVDPYASATKITNDTLKKEHCLGEICTKNLIIYEDKSYENIVFNIFNKSDSKKSGCFMVTFDDISRAACYKDLNGGEEMKFTIQLDDKRVVDYQDYAIRELTAEEQEKIKY